MCCCAEFTLLWQKKQLSDKNVYKKANFKSKILQNLAETRNQIFISLKKGKITQAKLKYFTINHIKVTNLEKMYLLPKIHKRLHSISWRPAISNCGTPTKKTSDALHNELNISCKKVLH